MPHDPELTPAEEQVRRLLADARHTEPMPDDVAARLDAVLTDLAAEHPGDLTAERAEELTDERRIADRSAAVAADLAAARRRRTARNLLVAAAAVVAIGIGLNSVDLTVSGGDDDSAAASSDVAADGAGAPEAASGEQSGADRDDGRTPTHELEAGKNQLGATAGYAGVPVRLSAERFGAQVRRLHTSSRTLALDDSTSASSDGLFSLGRSLRPGCSTAGWGAGLLVPARYDGQLGAVIFRKASGESQVVDLFLCGNDSPTRSITLPVR